jgi:hypothetical protein
VDHHAFDEIVELSPGRRDELRIFSGPREHGRTPFLWERWPWSIPP